MDPLKNLSSDTVGGRSPALIGVRLFPYIYVLLTSKITQDFFKLILGQLVVPHDPTYRVLKILA